MFISLECMYLFLFILKQLYHINCSYTNIFFFFLFATKNLWLTKGRAIVTPLTALSSNQLSWSKLLAVTLQSICVECQNKTVFKNEEIGVIFFLQPLNVGLSVHWVHFIRHAIHTLTSHTSFQLRYILNFLLFKKS